MIMMIGIGTPSSQSNIPRPISASFVHYSGGSHTDEPLLCQFTSWRMILVIKPANAQVTLTKRAAGLNKSIDIRGFC